MKLIRFTTTGSPSLCFGIVIRDQAVPFAEPMCRLLPSRWPLCEPLPKYHW
jgi:hypothetical protein